MGSINRRIIVQASLCINEDLTSKSGGGMVPVVERRRRKDFSLFCLQIPVSIIH
jgi:hypothetical protein